MSSDLTDGWGDEDLELDDGLDDDDDDKRDGKQEEVVFQSSAFQSTVTIKPQEEHHHQHHNDEKEGNVVQKDLHHHQANLEHRTPQKDDDEEDEQEEGEAWDFEDEELLESSTADAMDVNVSSSPPHVTTRESPLHQNNNDDDVDNDVDDDLFQDVSLYVTQQLPWLWRSINAILEAEYNTLDHAQHLVQYYQQRPQLATYTLEKELHRMQYRLDCHHRQPLQEEDNKNSSASAITTLDDPAQITQFFQASNNKKTAELSDQVLLLLAASNQSLLADLLHVMTGPDRLIRPQYMTSCAATTCQFHMNVTDPTTPLVTCRANFELSLPCHSTPTTTTNNNNLSSSSSSSSSRLMVATMTADITFQPSLPSIHYQITTFTTNQRDIYTPSLCNVARFLRDMGPPPDDIMLGSSPTLTTGANETDAASESNADLFRDLFLLEQTQDFIKSQRLGMKTAWNQVNAVVNLQSKFDTVQQLWPSLLSSGQDVVVSARAVTAAVAASATAAAATATTNTTVVQEEDEEEISFHQHAASPIRPLAPKRQPVRSTKHPPTVLAPPSTQLQQQGSRAGAPSSAATSEKRPASILGGFFSRLAQSVTIPDEEEVYRKEYGLSTTAGNTHAAPGASAAVPSLHLYRRDQDLAASRRPQQQQQQQLPPPPSWGNPLLTSEPPPPSTAAALVPSKVPPPPRSHNVAKLLASSVPNASLGQVPSHASHSKVKQPPPPPQVPSAAVPEEEVVQDGWEDEEETELLLDDNNDHSPEDATGHVSTVVIPGGITTKTVPIVGTPSHLFSNNSTHAYNPEDDIIETRKRWVNPRPGSRQITF